MRLTPSEAEAFFEHPSQRIMGLEGLPGDPFEYYARGNVCGAFHATFWPGVWMAHVGMKPEGWGRSDDDARAILSDFAAAKDAERLIAWISGKNRAAIAFARRLGFEKDGEMQTRNDKVQVMGRAF